MTEILKLRIGESWCDPKFFDVWTRLDFGAFLVRSPGSDAPTARIVTLAALRERLARHA